MEKEYFDYLKNNGVPEKDIKDYAAYLESEVPQEQVKESSSPWQAVAEKFANATTFGYAPQLQAITEPLVNKLMGEPTEKSYVERRDENIARQKAQEEEFPLETGAANIAGIIATPGMGMIKGASTLGKIAKAGLIGAGTGALMNPGDVEGEISPVQLGERATGAALGGLLGAGAQSAISVAGKAANAWAKKGDWLQDVATDSTIDAMGARKAFVKQLFDNGTTKEIADFARKQKLIKAGDTFDDAYVKVSDYVDKKGQEIGALYKSLKESASNPDLLANLSKEQLKELKASAFVPRVIVKDILKDIESEFGKKAKGPEAIKAVQSAIKPLLKFGKQADIDQIVGFRRSIDDIINFDRSVRDMPISQQALTKARSLLNDKIFKNAEVLDKISGGTRKADLKRLNKEFSLASKINEIVKDKAAAEQANRKFGLTDVLVGTSIGGPAAIMGSSQDDGIDDKIARGLLYGVPLALGSRMTRKYGPAIASDIAAGVGPFLNRFDKTQGIAKKGSGLLQKIQAGLIGSAAPRMVLGE